MNYHRSIVGFFAALLVFLCGSVADAVIISGYFPAHEGNFWNFSSEESKSISTWAINGDFSLRQAGNVFILLQDNERFICLKEDWEGLRIYGEFTADKVLVPDKPLLFLPREIDADPKMSIDNTATFKVFAATNPLNVEEFKTIDNETRTITFRMKGYDDIQIGSKKFEECIILEKITKIGKKAFTTETMWLAPSVGPVKIVVEKNGRKTTKTILSYAGAGTDQTKSFMVKDYFPLKPGLKWTYKDQNGQVRATETKLQEKAHYKDIMVTPFEDYLHDVHFFSFDDQGLVMEQKYWSMYGGCQAPVPPEQPPVVLPAELKLGEFHLSRSNLFSHRYPSMQLSPFSHLEFIFSGVPVSIEDVTTPAGTFKDCIKICMFYVGKAYLMQFDLLRIGYIWLAKDTGIVKEDVFNLFNFSLSERINTVYDPRFWSLSKLEEVPASKVLSYADSAAPEPAKEQPRPSGGNKQKVIKAESWEGLTWENNSKKMFEKAVSMVPFFVKPLVKMLVMDKVKEKAGAEKKVSEDLLIESIKEAAKGMPIKDMLKELEAMRSK